MWGMFTNTPFVGNPSFRDTSRVYVTIDPSKSKHQTSNIETRPDPMAISSLTQKYEEERQKRQTHSKGLAQYLNRYESPAFTLVDPWIENGTTIKEPVGDRGHVKIIIFGAGFAGLLAAVKCLDSGAASSPSDLLIVDPAGGFGGTWYWNRYVS